MDCKDIGVRIKQARIQAGLTQEKFAEMLDISISYISLIERGERNATIDTLLSIATTLNVSVSSLLQSSSKDKDDEHILQWKELMANRSLEEKDMILKNIKTIVEFLDNQKKM